MRIRQLGVLLTVLVSVLVGMLLGRAASLPPTGRHTRGDPRAYLDCLDQQTASAHWLCTPLLSACQVLENGVPLNGVKVQFKNLHEGEFCTVDAITDQAGLAFMRFPHEGQKWRFGDLYSYYLTSPSGGLLAAGRCPLEPALTFLVPTPTLLAGRLRGFPECPSSKVTIRRTSRDNLTLGEQHTSDGAFSIPVYESQFPTDQRVAANGISFLVQSAARAESSWSWTSTWHGNGDYFGTHDVMHIACPSSVTRITLLSGLPGDGLLLARSQPIAGIAHCPFTLSGVRWVAADYLGHATSKAATAILAVEDFDNDGVPLTVPASLSAVPRRERLITILDIAGSPVVNAHISLQDTSQSLLVGECQTNAEGVAVLQTFGLPIPLVASISHRNYGMVLAAIGDGSTPTTIVVQRTGHVLLQVRACCYGAPIRNGPAYLHLIRTSDRHITTTCRWGNDIVANIPEGTYDAVLRVPGLGITGTARVPIRACEVTPVAIDCYPEARYIARVKNDGDGHSITGVVLPNGIRLPPDAITSDGDDGVCISWGTSGELRVALEVSGRHIPTNLAANRDSVVEIVR